MPAVCTCVSLSVSVLRNREEDRGCVSVCVFVWVHVCLCIWDIVSSYLVIGTERKRGSLVLKSRPLEEERESGEWPQAKENPFIISVDCWDMEERTINLSLGLWASISRTLPFAVCLPNLDHLALVKCLTQSHWGDKCGVAGFGKIDRIILRLRGWWAN